MPISAQVLCLAPRAVRGSSRRAGLTEADICVGNFDDQTMVRIYARENATQRTKQVTALDGSVLAAMRLLARQLLGGTSAEIGRCGVFESEKAFDSAQGNLQSDKGIGQDLISRVLKDMPGMTRNSIGESLSRLKASGDYARTLTAIIQQIEAEAEATPAFPPFPPVPMGCAPAAEIVQKLHILTPKLYTEPLKILVQAGLAKTERTEGRIFPGNL